MTHKEYVELIQLCTKLIKRYCRDIDNELNKKCLFLRFGEKKWKVVWSSFDELVVEEKEIVDGDVRLFYVEGDHEICLERSKDFNIVSEFTLIDWKGAELKYIFYYCLCKMKQPLFASIF